ncbi:MAG: LamG domain-containing protein [Anaerolineae bacterium]
MFDKHLIAYYPLHGDCRDHSGRGHHGQNHGVDLGQSRFNGLDSYISVPLSPALDLHGDFTMTARIRCPSEVQGVVGDILSRFDPIKRKGFSLCVKSTAGGYSSQGDDKHLYFSIDDNRVGVWQSSGQPSPHSNYVSNSLTAYKGDLYAATLDAANAVDWCHVFRYRGGVDWEDCGRVGDGRTHGVGPMIVHRGNLYAATWNYDWTRVDSEPLDLCRVYRYLGGQAWQDCGQPGQNKRLIGLASYRGQLYTAGDDRSGGRFKLFAYDGGTTWHAAAEFVPHTPRDLFPHAMGVYNGKLYLGTSSIYAWDGADLEYVGTPAGCTQVHSLEVYRGQLYTGTWPEGKVFCYLGGQEWQDCGRLGDSIEVNALCVHNGKLYAGSIPRAEVYRYEGGHDWTRMARFYSPEGWVPAEVTGPAPEGYKEWTRVTSLTSFDGKLFAGIGSCTGSVLDAPLDVRGEVYAMETGECVSFDGDLGDRERHVAAVRSGNTLALYIDGELAASSTIAGNSNLDVANDEPLLIGNGGVGPFSGQIREVRLYERALTADEVRELYRG